MVAFLYNVPAGIPGDLGRPQESGIDAILLGTTPPDTFGTPLKYGVEDGITVGLAFEAGDTAADFCGVLTRQAPGISGSATNEDFGAGTPNAGAVNGRLYRGYINVTCADGTPVRGQPAYIRVVADTGKAIGDWEADADVEAVGAAAGGNTGNGTITLVSAGTAAKAGVYTIRMTAATTFTVSDPNGAALKPGVALGAYDTNEIDFTLTAGGTPWIAGDTLTVTVTANNIAVPGVVWAVDGRDTTNGNRSEIHVNYTNR